MEQNRTEQVCDSLTQWPTEFTPATRLPFPPTHNRRRLKTPPSFQNRRCHPRRRSQCLRLEPTSSRSLRTKSIASLRRRTLAATTNTLAVNTAGADAAAASAGSSESSSFSSFSSPSPPASSTSFSVPRSRNTPSKTSPSEELTSPRRHPRRRCRRCSTSPSRPIILTIRSESVT